MVMILMIMGKCFFSLKQIILWVKLVDKIDTNAHLICIDYIHLILKTTVNLIKTAQHMPIFKLKRMFLIEL